MMNNQFCGCDKGKEHMDMKHGCGCEMPKPMPMPCPTDPCCKPQPIVLPEQVRIVNTYSCVEVPVIQPICTRCIEHKVFQPKVYPVYKQTFETVCCQAPLEKKCCL